MSHRVPSVLGRGLTRRGRQRAIPGFTPTLIPGCELWLRADLGVHLTGGLADTWADQSGNARNGTSNPAGVRPAPAVFPGTTIPALFFDGTDAMVLPNFGALGDRTIIIVYVLRVLPAPATFFSLFTIKNVTGEFSEYLAVNNAAYEPTTFISDFNAVPFSIGRSSILDLNPHAAIVRYNGGLNTLPASYAFGDAGVNVPVGVSGADGRVGTDQASIGSRVNNVGALQFPSTVYIAEIIVYDHDLLPDEMTSIEGYLASRGYPNGPFIDDGIGVVLGVPSTAYWNPGMHPGDLTLGVGNAIQQCVNHLLPGTHDLIQPAPASQPIWTPAAWDATRAGMQTDALLDYLTANSLAPLINGNVAWNLILAINQYNLPGNNIYWSGNSGGNDWLVYNATAIKSRAGVMRIGAAYAAAGRYVLTYRYDGAGTNEARILTPLGEVIVIAAGACPLVAVIDQFFLLGYTIGLPISFDGCMRAGSMLAGVALTQANLSALAVYFRDSLDCPL